MIAVFGTQALSLFAAARRQRRGRRASLQRLRAGCEEGAGLTPAGRTTSTGVWPGPEEAGRGVQAERASDGQRRRPCRREA